MKSTNRGSSIQRQMHRQIPASAVVVMVMLLERVMRALRRSVENDEPETELNPGTIRPYRAIFSSPKTYFSRSILIDLVYACALSLAMYIPVGTSLPAASLPAQVTW